jgi:hypothetical protein
MNNGGTEVRKQPSLTLKLLGRPDLIYLLRIQSLFFLSPLKCTCLNSCPLLSDIFRNSLQPAVIKYIKLIHRQLLFRLIAMSVACDHRNDLTN